MEPLDVIDAIDELTKLRDLMLFDPTYGKEITYDDLSDENQQLYKAAGVAIEVMNFYIRSFRVILDKLISR